MLQGLSDTAVAERVGVRRVTIYRWRALHAPFRIELQRQQRALWLQGRERMRAMLHPALDVIERHLTQSNDPKVALRAAGMLLRLASPRRIDPPGPRDKRDDDETLDDIIEATRATDPTEDERG